MLFKTQIILGKTRGYELVHLFFRSENSAELLHGIRYNLRVCKNKYLANT